MIARRILERRQKFPDSEMYIALFPAEKSSWGDLDEVPEHGQGAAAHWQPAARLDERAQMGGEQGRNAAMTGGGTVDDGGQGGGGGVPSGAGRAEGTWRGIRPHGGWTDGLAEESHARRMAALQKSKEGGSPGPGTSGNQ